MPQITLTQLFDKRQLSTDPVELITYEMDAGFDRGRPDGVFFPESAVDVSNIMHWAAATKTPVVARGAGTGLSGGAVAEHGGVIVELARMQRVLELDVQGRSATVEPGMVNLAFDAFVKEHGLYYPPDPSSGRSSVLGGNLGENAGGPHCFKYGVTTNYVTGLEVVLADGQIVHAGGRAFDYPEYDFCGLLVGSEGTLGLITKAELRLIRNPPGVKTMMLAFDSEEQAGVAVSSVIAAGLVPATLEMMDQRVMRMIEAYVPVGLPIDARAVLIVEVDGFPASLDSQMEEVAAHLTANGGFDPRIAQSEDERQQIWYGRKSAAGAFSRVAPAFYLVDITVPRSRLADTLAAVNQICDRYRLTVGHVFHAGDGNLHPAILFNPHDASEKARVLQACEEIVDLCIKRNGSITGEHGVGIEKRAYMPKMYNGAELEAMREIKEIFDPENLLNPGKILPKDLPAVQHAHAALPAKATFSPTSVQEAAAGLAALSAAGKTVRIGGQAAGRQHNADVWLSTANLTQITDFAPEDLYVTFGAGLSLADLQAFLRPHGMQVPLLSPWPQATVGGLIATNTNSPLRMRYGSLRDVMLSTTVAMADGRVIRAGRPVVKNVAGYDLPKVFVGSYGTLGLLADVTLKLTPRPRAQRSLCVSIHDLHHGLEWAAATAPHWLISSGVVLCAGLQLPGLGAEPYTLVLTAEGPVEDIAAEFTELTAMLAGLGAPQPVETDAITAGDLWAKFLGGVEPEQMLVRAGIPPGSVNGYWSQLSQTTRDQATWLIDVANGLVYGMAKPRNPVEARGWLAGARLPALALGGYAVTVQLPPQWRHELDGWGYRPSTQDLMAKLKNRWDPANMLNPGSFNIDNALLRAGRTPAPDLKRSQA